MRSARVALLILILLPAGMRAQEVQFTCSVDRTEVPLGQQLQVTFTLSGGSLKQYRDFRAPDLNRDFMTLMGPSTSQQMQIVNGRVSTSIAWTYVLQPRQTGGFTLPAASIIYDGNTLRSNSVAIKVTSAVPNSGGTQREKSKPDVDLGDNLFIRAIPNKTDVYIGEPITVTYKLYSRVAFQLDNPIKLPRMVGFWSEDIEAPTRLEPRIEVYNGRQYETYMMRKVLYFPTQSGKLVIEPFEIGTTVRVRKRRQTGSDAFDRFFSDPFFDSYDNVKKTLLTQKVNVNVRPLPEEGRPKGFTGVVGDYEMDATLDRTTLKANETATLKVVLRGTGNLRLLDEPAMTLPSGVDRYDPTITEDVSPFDGTLRGSKSFEYILVPRFAGKVTIPPLTFSYFDLQRKKYVTLESASFVMDIAEGEERLSAGDLEQTRVDYLAMDIRGIREQAQDLARGGSVGVRPAIMALLYLLPLVLLASALVWKQRYDRLHGDIAGMKRRRATRIADRRLRESRRHLEAGRSDEYYLEIARALWGYVQDKLGLPTSAMTIETIVADLRDRGSDAAITMQVHAALEAVEFARFSPTRASDEEMRALYDTASEAIVSMEQALKGEA